jgi:GNAT superfamily N-acetyltransferase
MPSGSTGRSAISTEPLAWRFAPPSEADFEPLLALRIDVMREHLERVFRYKPSRARRIFRAHFDEPGMRLILMESKDAGDRRIGCVGFRSEPDCRKIDSFYLERRFHSSGVGTAILKVLLAEADAQGLPVRLEVLTGSKADRFYLRHGFVKLREDEIEAEYERPAPR